MNILRQAGVFRDRFAGLIQETDEGYCFAYDPAYLTAEPPIADGTLYIPHALPLL